jgi:hypothetical protein
VWGSPQNLFYNLHDRQLKIFVFSTWRIHLFKLGLSPERDAGVAGVYWKPLRSATSLARDARRRVCTKHPFPLYAAGALDSRIHHIMNTPDSGSPKVGAATLDSDVRL